MKTLPAATVVALAVLAAAVLPAASATAADLAVSGTVTLEGAPLGGVEVGWYDPLTDAAGETVADAAGTYALTVPDGHPYVLYAGIDHRPAEANSSKARWRTTGGDNYVGVYLGANGADLQYLTLSTFTTGGAGQNINLVRPATVSGTNKLLAGKKIALTRVSGDRVKTVAADSTGTFSITGVIPGNYRLATSGYPNTRFARYESPTLTARAGQTTRLDPVFQKTGSITGVITNKGKPVVGVSVASFLDNAYGDADVTDAKGRYTLTRESPGRYDIYLEPGGDDSVINNRKVLETHRTAVVKSGRTTHLDLAVKKGGVVSGTIAPTGAQGVSVYVVDPKGNLVGSAYVPTKAKKATPFTINAVAPGTATLYITKGYREGTYGSVAVTVRAGTDNRVGTVGFTKKTVSLSGKVIGAESGRVAFDSSVYSLSSGTAKVKNGRYTITRLIPALGTVGFGSTDAHVAKLYDVTPGAGVTRDVHIGKARPTYTGSFTAGLYPLPAESGSVWLPGRYADLGSIVVKNGVATGQRLQPGTGTLDFGGYDSKNLFQQFSPFYLTIPKSSAKITLKAATTTDGGTVPLTLHR